MSVTVDDCVAFEWHETILLRFLNSYVIKLCRLVKTKEKPVQLYTLVLAPFDAHSVGSRESFFGLSIAQAPFMRNA
jgi:hypothetical protein